MYFKESSKKIIQSSSSLLEQKKVSFDYRSRNILKEITDWDPDVFALQEVTHFDWFDKKFQEYGYTGVYQQRPNAKPDGCALFWKHKQFVQKSVKSVDFNSIIQTNDPELLRRYKKDNVGLIALLQDTQTQKSVVIATVHLHYNPELADVKTVQAFQFLQQIYEFTKENNLSLRKTPIILCGDFNSMPDSAVFSLIAQGSIPSEHPQLIGSSPDFFPQGVIESAVGPLYSAYSLLNHPITTMTPSFSAPLDYVFCSPHALQVIGVAECLSMEDLMENYFAAPGPKIPSDHFSLIVLFEI